MAKGCTYRLPGIDREFTENELKAYLLDGGLQDAIDNGYVSLEEQPKSEAPPTDTGKGKEPPSKPPTSESDKISDEDDDISNYEMTTSEEVGRFLSGETIEDVFGESPQGEQQYEVQKLSDMLQDGRNMIDIAMQRWGNDIGDYGRHLFQYIQGMSNDANLTNKKAVLMATFLGELKETMFREPDRRGELQPLYNAVEEYYQRYMNIRGKELVAGRLLRLYRDKYLGDIFVDKILEEDQVRQKKEIQKAVQNARIDDKTAMAEKSITAKEKSEQDKQDSESYKEDQKKNEKKPKLSRKYAKEKAEKLSKDLEEKYGGNKELLDKIKEAINKLKCD